MRKLIIFDLDGTILNTLTDLTNSVNYLLSYLNMPQKKEEELRYFLGYGPRYLLEKSIGKSLTDKNYEKLFTIYNNYYDKHKTDFTKPYASITKVLKTLKEKGYLLAVCSNKQHTATIKLIEELFAGIFDIVMGTTPNYALKPSPDMVLKIIEQIDVTKENVIYIGDTEIDMQTAINAGVKKIAVLYGFRKQADLEKYNIELFVDKPLEILKGVEELFKES